MKGTPQRLCCGGFVLFVHITLPRSLPSPKIDFRSLELFGNFSIFIPSFDHLHTFSDSLILIEKSWANIKHFLRDNLQKFKAIDTAIYSYFQAAGS